MSRWIIKLLDYTPDNGLSGPNAPTKYPAGTIVIAGRRPNSLCMSIRLVRADRESRLLTCQVGFNPAITQDNELARRKLDERWEEIRAGLQAALQQVADLHHPLPAAFDDIIFVMAGEPPSAADRAVVTADFDFGRRRRVLVSLRDEHELYLLRPAKERLSCWWDRRWSHEERANFAAREAAHALGNRLNQPTMAENYLRRGNDRLLREALITHLQTAMQSLYSVIFAHDQSAVAELAQRGRSAGAMTAVALGDHDIAEADAPPAPPSFGATITPATPDPAAVPTPVEPSVRCETLVACAEDAEPALPEPLPVSVPRAGTEFVVGAPDAPAHLRAKVARVPAVAAPKITQVKGGDSDKD